MHGGRGHVDRRPGHAVRRAAGHARDLLALQALHEGGLPVDGGRAVALLAVVIVAPGVDLSAGNRSSTFQNLPRQHLRHPCPPLRSPLTSPHELPGLCEEAGGLLFPHRVTSPFPSTWHGDGSHSGCAPSPAGPGQGSAAMSQRPPPTSHSHPPAQAGAPWTDSHRWQGHPHP